MPEPLEITSHLRTYSVSFVETLAEIAGEISSPGDFFIADPVVAEIVWGESPPRRIVSLCGLQRSVCLAQDGGRMPLDGA